MTSIFQIKILMSLPSLILFEFIFNINVPTRVGFQTPFTNITMDMVIPQNLKDEAVVVGGELKDKTYTQFL